MKISSRNLTLMVCTFLFTCRLPHLQGMLGMAIKVKRRFYGPIGRVNENVIQILLIEFKICSRCIGGVACRSY